MAERRTDEKRGGIRFACRRPVSYMVTGKPGSPPYEVTACGEIMDLSNGGIGMRTMGRSLEKGAVIQAWIPVSEPPVTLPVLTQVKWVRQERPGTYQIGLRFVL